MAGPVLDLGLQGGRWRLYRDPPRPPPVGVAVEGNGGDALMFLPSSPRFNKKKAASHIGAFADGTRWYSNPIHMLGINHLQGMLPP
jgi:hypothetical protein